MVSPGHNELRLAHELRKLWYVVCCELEWSLLNKQSSCPCLRRTSVNVTSLWYNQLYLLEIVLLSLGSMPGAGRINFRLNQSPPSESVRTLASGCRADSSCHQINDWRNGRRVKSRLSRSCPKGIFYGFPRPNLDNWPNMDKHGSLKMLLDTLLDKETLNSWQIYE